MNLNFTQSVNNTLNNECSFWRGRNDFWISRPVLVNSSSNFKPVMVQWAIFWRGRFGAFSWPLAELLRKSQIHEVCKIKCTPLWYRCYIVIHWEIIATDKTILLPAVYKKPGSFCKQMSATPVAINREQSCLAHLQSKKDWLGARSKSRVKTIVRYSYTGRASFKCQDYKSTWRSRARRWPLHPV